MGNSKAEAEKALEDLMVTRQGVDQSALQPAYYANAGMSDHQQIKPFTNTAAIKAFDGDERTAWHDELKSATSWIQCQYVDGRKYLVTSYVLVCKDSSRLPRSVEFHRGQ
jgi:hypothetical protein